MQPVLVGIAVPRDTPDDSGETVVGHWNVGCHDEHLDMIIVEDVRIANDSTKNIYPYRLPAPRQINTKVLDDIVGNIDLYEWDIHVD